MVIESLDANVTYGAVGCARWTVDVATRAILQPIELVVKHDVAVFVSGAVRAIEHAKIDFAQELALWNVTRVFVRSDCHENVDDDEQYHAGCHNSRAVLGGEIAKGESDGENAWHVD